MSANILIVDDDQGVLEVLSRLVQSGGYSTRTALDGRTALRMVRRSPPDLVVLDMVMPGVGGLGFLNEIRSVCPGLPVIMITGVLDERSARISMKLGAVDFLTKPLDMQGLLFSIKAALAARGRSSHPSGEPSSS